MVFSVFCQKSIRRETFRVLCLILCLMFCLQIIWCYGLSCVLIVLPNTLLNILSTGRSARCDFECFPLLCWSYNKVAKNGNKWHNVLFEVLEHSVSYGLVCQCLNERSSKTLGATYFWNAGLHDGSTCCQLSSLCDLFIYGLPAEMCCPNLYQVLCQQYIQCDIF